MVRTDTDIDFVKGVGPQRAEMLKQELRIFKAGDLLFYFPFRYIDRSRFYKVNELHQDLPHVQVQGVLSQFQELGKQRGKRLVAKLVDETGELELVWFKGVRWVKQQLKPGKQYIAFGKPTAFNGKLNIAHPEMDEPDANAGTGALQPVYSTTEKLSSRGLNSRGIERLIKQVLPELVKQVPPSLSASLREKYHLLSRADALRIIHSPTTSDLLQRAEVTLKFEELFYIQLQLMRMKLYRHQYVPGFQFPEVGRNFLEFYNNRLPFELTGAQKRVMKEIRKDLRQGFQMNRLLQGDVGSGKTMVAILCMLLAIDNAYQAAMMAPTEILARQHYEGVRELLEPLGLKVRILTGSTGAAERRKLHAALEEGAVHVLIGTHALFEKTVKFSNLGLVVIDEQHRFGVAQRGRMWKKNNITPHILVMSATPIPRTLAMSIYGDLDVSVIDELPPGRKPVQTKHVYDAARLKVFGFIRKEIAKGRQVYMVYPLIDESETLDLKNLNDGYESVSRAFPEFQVSVVHGKMKAADKDFEMQRFIKGETHIMVATTVIEVGVNVPNASVMVIENAERFGLAQLHQLRGRVGRGADQSYCILMTGNKLTNDAKTRMETMVRTTDGFEVAEVDLRLRGPGDLLGTQQSGLLNLKLADLAKDTQLVQLARDAAQHVLKVDPDLSAPAHQDINRFYARYIKSRPNWSRVS